MIKLSFLSGKKFIMTIGDEGAVLTLTDKGMPISRLFAPSPSLQDRKEMHALFVKHPLVPISVLLDGMEQTYIKQSLPAVSSFNIGKLVKRRLDRDFAKTDIKGASPRGRDSTGRKDWQYMFVSTPLTPYLNEWLEYFLTLQNSFDGIYLLPMEMENIAKEMNKFVLKGDAEKTKWQFIVTHNKTGGFRQTVLHNEKVVFTRLVKLGKESLPDIIAGNIEQEIINTIDYLRRLEFTDDDSINIFVIASKELKTSLVSSKIRGKPLLLFTPHELSELTGHGDSASKDDKFADILLATIFANHSPVLKLENPKAKSVNNLLLVYKISSVGMIVLMPVLAIYAGIMVFNIISHSSQMKDVEDKKVNIEKLWKNVKNTGEYSIEDANKITDAIALRKKIRSESTSPLEMLERFASMDLNFIHMQSATWSFDKDYVTEGKKSKISSLFNLEFSTKGSSLDAMFKNYELLSNALNAKYNDFAIEISKLPEKITFDDKTENLIIQVKFLQKDVVPGAPPAPPPPPPPPANGGI